MACEVEYDGGDSSLTNAEVVAAVVWFGCEVQVLWSVATLVGLDVDNDSLIIVVSCAARA